MKTFTRWTIMLPTGQYGWFEDQDEARDEARLLMEEEGLEKIEVAELRITTGGYSQNGVIEHQRSEFLYNEAIPA